MEVLNYILATAGHVDHGKSSLVKALTGIDPDRLPEEKARGITIELGFAHLDLPHPSAPEKMLRIGLVDVPGHEDFVKNMVAGVGAIDVALLVVAADDGWMPQTEEHLQILDYLGARRGLIALTKIDLTDDGGARATLSIRERLDGTPLASAPIVCTSIRAPETIGRLREALADLVAATPPPEDRGKPRLPVDRAFILRGIGTVVTGTLTGGSLARGQEIIIQPWGGKARIRAVQSHNQEVPSAGPALEPRSASLTWRWMEPGKRG